MVRESEIEGCVVRTIRPTNKDLNNLPTFIQALLENEANLKAGIVKVVLQKFVLSFLLSVLKAFLNLFCQIQIIF